MTYCSNCGCKIEGNDLFCPNCGTKVGQSSNANQNKEKVDGTFDRVKSITNQINFSEITNTLKLSALNPVSGGKKFVAKTEKNYVIIITIILALIQGILGMWRIEQIISNLQTIVSKFLLNLSSLSSLFGGNSPFNFSSGDFDYLKTEIIKLKPLINIPYGKIFFWNCVIYLIGLSVLFIFIYLGISILTKVKQTPILVFKVVLISSLPILTFEIISILFSYLSISLGVAFMLLGTLISITTLVLIVKESLLVKEDLCTLIVSISFLITLVILSITIRSFISSNLLDIVTSTINSFN